MFETLESRLPLAGEVLVKDTGGTLKLTGDDLANDITITQDATISGKFVIVGNAGTTFKLNGVVAVSPVTVEGILKDITIDLKKGDDTVTLVGDGVLVADNTTARNVTINTRQGKDTIEVNGAKITGNLTIDAASGDLAGENDTVFMRSIDVAKNVTVKTGKGADDVDLLISAVVKGNLTVDTGAGDVDGDNDDINLEDINVTKNVTVKTGKGNDDAELSGLLVSGVVTGKVTIDTGAGNDDAIINNFDIAQTLSIKTGAGFDNVDLGSGQVSGNATISTGAEEDTVEIVTQLFLKNLSINTGNANIKTSGPPLIGVDVVEIREGSNTTGKLTITTGDGNDDIELDSSSAATASISTGKGNDDVKVATRFNAAVTVDQAIISLGAGDDELVIGSVANAAAKLILNGPKKSKVAGGAGTDTLITNDDLAGAGALTAVITGIP